MKNDFYIGIYEDLYLAHHQIDGAKWGIMNGPPYPLDRKTHDRVVKKGRAEKKKEGLLKSLKTKYKKKKTAKKRKAALKKARAARAAKAAAEKKRKKMEADKERVLKSGTATEVAKYRGQLTNKELQDVWYRLQTEGQILSKAEAENLKPDKVKEFFDKVDKYTKYADIGIKAWDTGADIYNAFAEPKVKMKKIRGGKDKKKDD